jgi:hypothetical protein
VSARSGRASMRRLRVVAGVGRIEAVLLVRSGLLLAGAIGGTALFWQFAGGHQPLWWPSAGRSATVR